MRVIEYAGLLSLLVIFYLAAESRAAGAEDWNQLLARARQEGQVVLGTNQGIPAFRQGVVNAFLKRFGISVELRVFRGAELSSVAARECAAGRPSMDVLLGGNGEVLTLYPKKCLAQLKPGLTMPEVVNPDNWQDGFLKWTDPEAAYLLQTSDMVYGSLIANTDETKLAKITSAKDLLRSEYKGRIASYDPRASGAGQSDATYLLTVLGEEYVRKLFLDQKVVYTTDHRQLADWVARGTYRIALGSVDRTVEPLRRAGLPIGVVASLKDAPGYLTGGSSVLKLVKDSPHPNAALVLLNWLASKEGQDIFEFASGHPSRRVDTDRKGIPEHRIPKPGIKYLDTYTYDFYTKKRPEITRKLVELLGR